LRKQQVQTHDDSEPQAAVFTFLLAWSLLFDHRTFLGHLLNFSSLDVSTAIHISTCIIAVWAIVKPSSLVRFLCLVIVGLADFIYQLPVVPNHHVFELVVFATILTSFFYLRFKKRNGVTKTEFYELFAPILRIELIVLYFWVAVHKFNTGFLDQDISCATVQYFNIKTLLPFLPVSDWILNFNIYGTLSIEILIPLLLIIPKTRVYGLILGVLFHSILGLRYQGFTALMFALFSLFIPLSCYDHFKSKFMDFRDKISDKFPSISNYRKWEKKYFNKFVTQALFMTIILLVLRFFMRGNTKSLEIHSSFSPYIAYVLILVTFFFLMIRVVKPLGIDQSGIMVPKVKWLLIFPFIIFLNGVSPHLGLKNVQVLAMYSNLRTEGGKTNHLFIPSSFQVFNTLEDLVTIKKSNHKLLNSASGYLSNIPWWGTNVKMPSTYIKYMRVNNKDFLGNYKYKLPFVFLQNNITGMANKGMKNINLEYERGGKIFRTHHAELEPDLSQASIFQRKLLYLRAVPDDEKGLCMW